MRKEHVSIPRPQSAFILVQCPSCGNEVPLFSATTVDIKCRVCGTTVAEKTGGKARITGTVLRRLD